jgi:hypothetical protein
MERKTPLTLMLALAAAFSIATTAEGTPAKKVVHHRPKHSTRVGAAHRSTPAHSASASSSSQKPATQKSSSTKSTAQSNTSQTHKQSTKPR